jgi:hypothetical protein
MSVSRNVATVLLERVFDNYLWELGDDAQQIVGPTKARGIRDACRDEAPNRWDRRSYVFRGQ